MKILAFTDTHGSPSDLAEVKKKAKDADIIVCTGDFTIFENEMEYVLQQMNKLPKKVLIIHGNHEDEISLGLMAETMKNIKFLHEKIHEEEEYLFIGYGGGGFSTRDAAFEKFADSIKHCIKERKSILLVHGPPHGTKVDKMGAGYVGNKSFTKFINDHQPDLVLCGHLHENFGKRDKIGKTRIINPGPEGELIDL